MFDDSVHIPGWLVLIASAAYVVPAPILIILPSRIVRTQGAVRILASLALGLAAAAYLTLLDTSKNLWRMAGSADSLTPPANGGFGWGSAAFSTRTSG